MNVTTLLESLSHPAFLLGFENWDNDEFDCPYQIGTPEMADFRLGRAAGEETHEQNMNRLRERQFEENAERFSGGAY